MAIINRMLKKLDDDVVQMQHGLQPASLAYWYDVVLGAARRYAPPYLHEKINVIQDPILPMKFRLDISKRAVKYVMMAMEENLDSMPYTTRLYFLRVQKALTDEVDKSFV